MIISFLISPVDFIDATAQTWHSSPTFQASYVRENSNAGRPRPFFVVQPHLPIVADKPNYRPQPTVRMTGIVAKPGRDRVVRVVSGSKGGSGQCVAYARLWGFEIYGNANKWPILAETAGYAVDKTPEIGAIIATSESSAGTSTGHVTGAIKSIDGNWAYISEQNYVGGKVTEGWIDLTSPLITAFIHPKIDRS